MNFLAFLDYAGIALFAATGALAASRKELDIVGFLFLAFVTATGGGTVRDLILDVPVFWLGNHTYILVAFAAAVLVFFTAHLIEYRYRFLLWLDAVALSAYAILGAQKGLLVSGSPVVAIITGSMTAALGGILRDVIAGEPTVITGKELYVSAAAIGAGGFVAALALGAAQPVAAVVGFVAALVVRGGGIALGWSLPPYKSRPGRPV